MKRLAIPLCFLSALILVGFAIRAKFFSDDGGLALQAPGERGTVDPAHSSLLNSPFAYDSRKSAVSGSLQETSQNGFLSVSVYRAPSLPLAGIGVRASGKLIGVTDVSGLLRVELPPGRYGVKVDESSLSDELLAPVNQEVQDVGYETPDGFFGRTADVQPGTEVAVALRVFLEASLTGVVVDVSGQPVTDCPVRLQMFGAGLSPISYDATTGSDGLYAFRRLAPGAYVLMAYAATVRPSLPTNPVAMRVDVVEGGRLTVAPMVAGDTSGRVVGRFVDQNGGALAGVEVMAYPAADGIEGAGAFNQSNCIRSVITDANGEFDLRIPRVRVVVQVDPASGAVRVVRLKKYVAPIVVDLTKNPVVSLGDITGEVSTPLFLEISLKDNVDAVLRVDPGLTTVASADVFVASAEHVADESKWVRIRRGKDDLHHFSCEAPAGPVFLIVRRAHFAPYQQQIEVVPGVFRVSISYP